MFQFRIKIGFIFIGIAIAMLSGHSSSAQNLSKNSQILYQIEQYSRENRQESLNQVINVKQLKDVSPTDWSYEAVRGLVERYSCISGLPDGTFQGDRPIIRNEFAAGLNSCFEQIERSIDSRK